MNKKLVASMIALTLVFGAAGGIAPSADLFGTSVTASAAAQDGGKYGENIEWSFDGDGTLTISGTGSISGKTFDYPWKTYSGSVKKLVINEGITEVGYASFETFFYLEKVTLPESVTIIGPSAFQSCESLTEINFPSKLENIDLAAFASTGIVTADIPASVKNIGYQAFHICPDLTTIKVAEDNPYYTAVDDVLFTKDMKTLHTYASRKPQTEYTVPDSVTCIADTAFDMCAELTAVNLGAAVESMPFAPFYCSAKLTTVNVSEDNPNFKSVDGVVYSKDGKTIVAFPMGKSTESFDIPAGVTTVGATSFAGSKLKKINIPDTVTTIEKNAFFSGHELVTLDIPESVAEIGEYAFMNCDKLRNIYIPKNVNKIGEGAFCLCEEAESITIENTDCEIADTSSTLPYKLVIKGHDGSTAQAYAEKYGRKFVSLDKKQLIGDANCDGDINVTDISVTAAHIKGIKALTGDGLTAADVNNDGDINVTDIAMTASHIKGIKALS